MAAVFNITVRAGREFYLPVNVVTALGNPANMSGYQLEMTIKKAQGDTDAQALYKSAPWVKNLAFGQFTFQVTRAQNAGWWVAPPSGSGALSSTMVYDVSCLDVAIPPNMVTLLEGSVGMIGPVTVTIP
jgi:hypothetical protein